MTRGDQGMWLLGGRVEGALPAAAREVADVTGAGDTVIARWPLRSRQARRSPKLPGWRIRQPGLPSASSDPRSSHPPNCSAASRNQRPSDSYTTLPPMMV